MENLNQLDTGGIGYIGEGSGYNYAFGDIIGRLGNTFSGTAAQNAFNMQEAEKTRQFNAAEAQKDRDWQERMSNSAYQRAVADMLAAGINPAMLTGGMSSSASGASTPSGSAASSGASAKSASRKRSDIIGALVKVAGMIMLAG